MILLLLIPAALCVKGVDVSVPISASKAACFVSSGYEFAIVRAWSCSQAVPDTASVGTYNAFRSAGMKHVGIYIFPCCGGNCPSATTQVQGVVNFLNAHSMQPDSVWLDIETPNAGQVCFWQGSSSSKQAFYKELVAAARVQWPGKLGIYSSYSEWQAVFGSQSWKNPTDDSDLPMWYARYSGGASFDDFTPFSAWQQPFAKQYQGDATVCGLDADIDYAPVFSFDGSAPVPTPPVPMPAGNAYPVVPCNDSNTNPGYCTDSTTCNAISGTLHSSSSGAQGCGALASAIQCCTGGNGVAPALQTCNYGSISGKCLSTTTCQQAHGYSRRASATVKGCEALPKGIQCCLPASSGLQDGYSMDGGSLSVPSSNTALIAGVVAGALVLVLVVIGVAVGCIVRRRKAASSGGAISYGNSAYTPGEKPSIVVTPESISGGKPQFL